MERPVLLEDCFLALAKLYRRVSIQLEVSARSRRQWAQRGRDLRDADHSDGVVVAGHW
jgi:hypothetical protein